MQFKINEDMEIDTYIFYEKNVIKNIAINMIKCCNIID